MKRFFCIVAFLLVALYLWAGWTDWFTRAARSSPARNPLFSDPIDLRRCSTVTWKVPKDWTFREGKAHLSLALNVAMLREIPRDRSQVELRVKVAAYGQEPNGNKADRLIKDWYFTTDEPFSKDGQSLWEQWGLGRAEFGLAGIEVRPDEEMVIELHVTVPDPQLALGNPRLKLVADQGPPAIPMNQLWLQLLHDGGFVLSLILLFGLLVLAWGKNPLLAATGRCPSHEPSYQPGQPDDRAS